MTRGKRDWTSRVGLPGILLTLGVTACSEKGQLILVVDTDLSLPKDVESVTIDIARCESAGPTRASGFPITLDHFGPGADSLKIPATLAIGLEEGRDPAMPIGIQITGSRGKEREINGSRRKEREIRRGAITTIPAGRAAELRLPLQFLCVNEGDASICDEGNDTCIGGELRPGTISSAALPDYVAEDVFGGGTGVGDGECFDTSRCFEGATVAPVRDSGECAFAGGPGVNMAISTETDGICGPAGCFVPLDFVPPGHAGEGGFQLIEEKPGLVRLPPAVCNSERPLKVVTSMVSSTCKLKTKRLPTCGTWSVAGPQIPLPGHEKPVTVAALQNRPRGLCAGKVDGQDQILWTNAGSPEEASGAVRMIPLGGGAIRKLTPVEKEANPRQVKLLEMPDGSATIYWTNHGPETKDVAQDMGGISSVTVSKPSEMSQMDWTVHPWIQGRGFEGIALRPLDGGGTEAFWTDRRHGEISHGPVTSPYDVMATKTIKQLDDDRPYQIAVDKEHIFWTNYGTGKVMMARRDASGDACTLAEKQGKAHGLALKLTDEVATSVFWTNFDEIGSVNMVHPLTDVECKEDKAAPTPVLIASENRPKGVFVDETHVYWTSWGENGNGTVKRKLLSDAEDLQSKVETLADRQSRPGAIFVLKSLASTTNILWINEGVSDMDGAVMRLVR